MKWWLLRPEDPQKFPQITIQKISDDGLVLQVPNIAKTPDIGAYTKEEVTHIHLDCGGAIWTDAKLFEKEMLGAHFGVYAVHVDHAIAHLQSLVQRPSGLYIFGGWPTSTVFTEDEKKVVTDWLTALLPEAMAHADAENTAFNKKFVDEPSPHVLPPKPRPVRGKMGKA